ncbi:MAG: LD-carboxypeptidase [Bdellovibrionales bacterium]
MKTVTVVAPSSRSSKEELKRSVKVLRDWGIEARFPKNMMINKIPYLAQTDDVRFELFKAALKDESDVIWGIRGGFGAIRLIENLTKLKAPKNKIFIGLSDHSILHLLFNQFWGLPTVHAPVLNRLGDAKCPVKEKALLKEFLSSGRLSIQHSSLKPMNLAALRERTINASVVGGNLVSLQSLQGTPFQLKARGKILFLEDIGERGYAIDRALTSLKLCGSLAGCKAIVFGDFTSTKESNGKDHSIYALKSFAESLNIPVFRGVKSGHGKLQLPVIFGKRSKLLCDGNRTRLEQVW